MTLDLDDIPVVTLFRGPTFNGLTSHIVNLDTEPPTEWVRKGDIADMSGVSDTAVSVNQDQAIKLGLLERSDDPEEVAMARYRIPDTPVVALLRSFHEWYDPKSDPDISSDIETIDLSALMELVGRARLIGWLLFHSDPTKHYSKSGLAEAAPVGHTTVLDHIDKIFNHGIVTSEDASNGSQTYTEYRFNEQSHVADILYLLNDAIVAHAKAHKRGL